MLLLGDISCLIWTQKVEYRGETGRRWHQNTWSPVLFFAFNLKAYFGNVFGSNGADLRSARRLWRKEKCGGSQHNWFVYHLLTLKGVGWQIKQQLVDGLHFNSHITDWAAPCACVCGEGKDEFTASICLWFFFYYYFLLPPGDHPIPLSEGRQGGCGKLKGCWTWSLW